MGQVRQRLLIAGLLLLLAASAGAQKFYPDDPLWKEPPPLPVKNVIERKLSEYYDFFTHTFATPGQKQPKKGEPIAARAVNTLGEVPDSSWYTNRHGRARMSLEELRRGPNTGDGPSYDGQWIVSHPKDIGVTPGFTIKDPHGQKYVIKVDPLDYPDMATAAEVIGAKFFHALGYWVPENYVVMFDREQLVVAADASIFDIQGKTRRMHERDVDEILLNVPRDSDGRYLAVASKHLEGRGVGSFRFYGVRKDDPNDVVPHEHRRDLRGLFVFCAWLGHNDVKSLNNFDSLVEKDGVSYVRHNLFDFGAAFGSDSFTAKSPRAGNQYMVEFAPSILQIATLGLFVPRWATAHYPNLPEVGRFESDLFEPERWKPNYPNPAFDNRLPDDTFWAAKQVMAFTDEDIRAIVETGRYKNPASVDWLTRCLIARRDKIGRTYFAKVLPLDRFRIADGQLAFEDLAVKYGFVTGRRIQVQWSRFNNQSRVKTPVAGATSLAIPPEARAAGPGEYFAADLRADNPKQTVTAYLRGQNGDFVVVGIDRTW